MKPISIKATRYYFITGCTVSAVWGVFLLEHFTDWRVSRGSDGERMFSLEAALIATPIIVGIGWYLLRRAQSIAARGMELVATIDSIRGGGSGYRNVSFSYVVNGKTFRGRSSITNVNSADLEPGDELVLIVDSAKPKRFLVQVEVV